MILGMLLGMVESLGCPLGLVGEGATTILVGIDCDVSVLEPVGRMVCGIVFDESAPVLTGGTTVSVPEELAPVAVPVEADAVLPGTTPVLVSLALAELAGMTVPVEEAPVSVPVDPVVCEIEEPVPVTPLVAEEPVPLLAVSVPDPVATVDPVDPVDPVPVLVGALAVLVSLPVPVMTVEPVPGKVVSVGGLAEVVPVPGSVVSVGAPTDVVPDGPVPDMTVLESVGIGTMTVPESDDSTEETPDGRPEATDEIIDDNIDETSVIDG